MGRCLWCVAAGFPGTGNYGIIAAGPDVPALYPEYLTDPNIIVCPSDASHTKDDLINDITGETDFGYPCNDANQGWAFVDSSYWYLGWVWDQGTNNPPANPVDFVYVQAAFGPPVPPTATAADVSGQICAALAVIVDEVAVNYNFNAVDNDVSVASPFGNGGGTTVYRLREGIERFMITDINNPAGSAQAQSEIWVMADIVSTEVSLMNHVPGGANTLFMDGHVEFLRYQPDGDAPVNAATAILVSMLGD